MNIFFLFQQGSVNESASMGHVKSKGIQHQLNSKCPGVSVFSKSMSSIDLKIFSLVNEVSRSKDETIAAKNHTIKLLESMLKIDQINAN